MEMNALWEKTCGLLMQTMSYVSYSTWIDGNMSPVSLQDGVLTVCIQMGSMRTMIQNKYGALIDKCLTETAGKPLRAELLTRQELASQTKAVPEDNDPHLNPKYTFESFVVGDGNRFAHAAALAVAESPAEAYNPLFLYGGVGLGKTHLMQAVGHFVHQQDPGKKILYMTSESFTNDLISAIQQKKTYEFRDKIRKADILMIDDVQFIAGRESTQQEFFNTFNELHNNGKQIILTSDRPPQEIQRLEDRLVSRFEWGLVADIQKPDIETRMAILRKKTTQDHLKVPDSVLEMIASRIDTNIRELEGCLTRLVAFANLVHKPISEEMCEEALKDVFDRKKTKKITAELVMKVVSDYYGLTIGDLTGKVRRKEIARPRQIAMYITRTMTNMSLPQIGAFFGRDHTTVIHSCREVANDMQATPSFRTVVDEIQKKVQDA